MGTAILTGVTNGCESPAIGAELRQTLQGMLSALEYSPITVRDQPDQPFAMDMHYDRTRGAYRFTVASETGDFTTRFFVPMAPFRALIDEYERCRNGNGLARNSIASDRARQKRFGLRNVGSASLQEALKTHGVTLPSSSTNTLFRVIATEYKIEAGLAR